MIQFLNQKLINEEEGLKETIHETIDTPLKVVKTKGMFQKEMRADLTIKNDKKWLRKVNPDYATQLRINKINDLKK